MYVVVSHLTRMKPGYFCVAGIDPNTGRHIRPTLGTRLETRLLRQNGGVFEIGALVDLGKTITDGKAPELEDHLFHESNLRFDRNMKPDEFWKIISDSSTANLKGVFGTALEVRGRGCAVALNSGSASLGCLSRGAVELDIDRWDKVKLQIQDGEFSPYLSVTDIRMYKSDQKSPRHTALSRLMKRLTKEKVMICVGLARAWQQPGDTESRHWLQVNNLHFESDPLGGSLY
jgi:hypothetical protein